MSSLKVEVGGTYWLVTRERVRAGKGPRKVEVTDLVYATQNGHREVIGAQAGSSYVSVRDLCPAEDVARYVCRKIAEIELQREIKKFYTIRKRLVAAATACNSKEEA